MKMVLFLSDLCSCNNVLHFQHQMKQESAAVLSWLLISEEGAQCFTAKYVVSCRFPINVFYQIKEIPPVSSLPLLIDILCCSFILLNKTTYIDFEG